MSLEGNNKNKKKRKDKSNNNGKLKTNEDKNEVTKMERKTTVWIFQDTNKWDCSRENLDMVKKGKSQEKIAAQNNAIRTN